MTCLVKVGDAGGVEEGAVGEDECVGRPRGHSRQHSIEDGQMMVRATLLSMREVNVLVCRLGTWILESGCPWMR